MDIQVDTEQTLGDHPHCGACRFYLMFTCRRHAPVGIADEPGRAVRHAVWPPVTRRDVCGDFSARGYDTGEQL